MTTANGRPRRYRGRNTAPDALARADVLTTGQAAAVCGVAPRTVSKWLDAGVLAGYKIPTCGGGGRRGQAGRRVARGELARFLTEHGMADSLARLGATPPALTVLLCGLPDALAVALFHAAGPGVALKSPLPNLLALGYALAGPFLGGACAVLDASLGRGECLAAGRWLATHAVCVRLVGLCGEDDVKGGDWTLSGYAAVLGHPVRPGDVLAAVREGGG
jgi:two-component system, OmpR family, response regulator RpaA